MEKAYTLNNIGKETCNKVIKVVFIRHDLDLTKLGLNKS